MNNTIEFQVERYTNKLIEERRESIIKKYKAFVNNHAPQCMIDDLKKFAEKEGVKLDNEI